MSSSRNRNWLSSRSRSCGRETSQSSPATQASLNDRRSIRANLGGSSSQSDSDLDAIARRLRRKLSLASPDGFLLGRAYSSERAADPQRPLDDRTQPSSQRSAKRFDSAEFRAPACQIR